MQSSQCEGIVLQSLNFQDYDKIITVFSYEEGVLKFHMKGASRSASSRLSTNPLTCAEFTYTKGRGDLLMCREIAVKESFLKLRQSLPMLEAAMDMLQVLIQSQLPHKPAPKLYQLLKWCLNKLAFSKDPHFLAASFRLKLLIHDGLLMLQNRCTTCGESISELYIAQGETFCLQHAPTKHFHFNNEENALLAHLLNYQSFAEIALRELPPILREKIIELSNLTLKG